MVWKAEDPQGNEAGKIRHLIVPYTRGIGLDLGCGPWKAWPHFISVDDHSEWEQAQPWAPDVRADCTKLSMFADGGLDFVFSSHLLEHIEDTEAALQEWWRTIKPEGHLVLYLPHKELYPQIGQEGANPDHKHDFAPDDIIEIMRRVGSWDLVENETRSKGCEYSFFQVYRKLTGTHHLMSYEAKAKIGKPRCLVMRYGAFGDHLMASSILPGLKEQGYHVTYQTTPKGHDVLRYDPHIDAFSIQDIDQVPNHQLGDYWKALGGEFDKVINLSESVEDTLLATPGRRTHAMPQPARHALMNLNYLEFTHQLAGVPLPPRARFYPNSTERKAAEEMRAKMGPVPLVVWALAGSSVHKAWPWTDAVVAWLLENTNARIAFVGGPECQILEIGICQSALQHFKGISYEDSSEMKFSEILLALKTQFGGANRILCTCGAWDIRKSLTFACYADCVVGPETGVLNAVGLLDVPKVVFLSHSSAENLTKHWRNCTALESRGCPDSPCHRLHYSREFCPEDKDTGASLCMAALKPELVYRAITDVLRARAAA